MLTWKPHLPDWKSPRTQWLFFVVAIIAILLFLQLPHIHDNFLSDDYDWVHNARVRNQTHEWLNAFQTSTGGNFYRPLVAFGFELDYKLFGYNPTGYHAHQLLFHIILIIGIAFMLWQIFRSRKIAFFVALLFAVYPSHHEVVTWIAGRPDLYAATFSVWAVACFVAFLRNKTWWQYALALFFSAAAFLSKEIAFALPALMALGILFVIPVKEWKKLLVAMLWILPIACMLGGVLLIRSHIISDAIGGYIFSNERAGLNFRIANIAKPFTSIFYLANWSYVAERFGHAGVLLRTNFLKATAHWTWLVAIALAAEAGIWLKWKNRQQLRIWIFGIAWSLIAFVPIYGLSNYIATNLTASRLFFASSIGYCCVFVAYCWPLAHVTGWKHLWKAVYVGIFIAFFGIWLFNAVPWKSATQHVGVIRKAIIGQQATLIPQGTDTVMVSGLPGLVQGAYMYFGNHSIYETMYEITHNDHLMALMVGSRAYPDSPLCENPQDKKLVSIRWDAKQEIFFPSHESALVALASTTPEPAMVWDFSKPETAVSWTFSGSTPLQKPDGLQLTVTKATNSLTSPLLDKLLLTKFKTIAITFSAQNISAPFQTTIQWSVNGAFKNGGSIAYPFANTQEVAIAIPTCQYLNWSLSENVDSLRIFPVQKGTVTLHAISLLP